MILLMSELKYDFFYLIAKEGGNVGVIHLIENETDINYVTSEGTTWPYIAVLPVKYFTL